MPGRRRSRGECDIVGHGRTDATPGHGLTGFIGFIGFTGSFTFHSFV